MEWVPFVWLMVVLKVPLAAALWIVWWALRSEPEVDEGDREGGDGRGPDHPRPRRPRPPRRGPHGAPPPASPARVRARSPRRTHTHR